MLYLIKGPDHMTVYLCPASGVYLVRSSLGSLYPIQGEADGGRWTYFIYYSHGTDVGPWEFSLYLAVSMQFVKGYISPTPTTLTFASVVTTVSDTCTCRLVTGSKRVIIFDQSCTFLLEYILSILFPPFIVNITGIKVIFRKI